MSLVAIPAALDRSVDLEAMLACWPDGASEQKRYRAAGFFALQ